MASAPRGGGGVCRQHIVNVLALLLIALLLLVANLRLLPVRDRLRLDLLCLQVGLFLRDAGLEVGRRLLIGRVVELVLKILQPRHVARRRLVELVGGRLDARDAVGVALHLRRREVAALRLIDAVRVQVLRPQATYVAEVIPTALIPDRCPGAFRD